MLTNPFVPLPALPVQRIFIDDQSEEDRADTMNEITVLSNVAHPNIVAYYGSFVEDNILNVVMEYADNGSLFQHIQASAHPVVTSDPLTQFASRRIPPAAAVRSAPRPAWRD